MLGDLAVLIGVKDVRCDPLRLAVAKILIHVAENEIPVLKRAHNLNVAHLVVFLKRREEFNAPFLTIAYTC